MQIKIDYQEAKAILESQKTMILGVEREIGRASCRERVSFGV